MRKKGTFTTIVTAVFSIFTAHHIYDSFYDSSYDSSSVYSRLDPAAHDIRILSLEPGRGWSPISTSLHPVKFIDRPRYAALSYAWGTQEADNKLWIGHRTVSVGHNLFHALKSMRSSESSVSLWVDAVCIDQMSPAEKNFQVPIMAFIYRRANEVIIWLGVHRLPLTFAEMDLGHLSAELDEARTLEPDKYRSLWLELEPWLYRLIYEEYWKRLWIVQEICLAANLYVHFGTGRISWDTFVNLVMLYKHLHTTDHRADIILNLAATRSDMYQGGEAYSLSSLLNTYKNAFCQDPRDKIYGFLGMASDHVDQTIPVDYRKSLPEVYGDVVRFFNSSTIDSERKRIEMLYVVSMVRQLLTRGAKLVSFTPKRQRGMAWTEKLGKAIDSINKYEVLEDHDFVESVPLWVSIVSELMLQPAFQDLAIDASFEGFKRVISHGSLWPETRYTMSYLPSLPEEEGFWAPNIGAKPLNLQEIVVRASIAGRVERLGPLASDLLSSFVELKKWNAHVMQHFQGSMNLNHARAQNERLISILSQSPSAKYEHIRSYDTVELSSQPRVKSCKEQALGTFT